MTGRPKDTTYAILGLLAMRDWAAYELTKEMRRSLRYFWPRAESAVYGELKKLKDSGDATTRVERRGQRATTIYSITPEGSERLREWLGQDPRRGVLLESEGLLRIFSSASSPPDRETVLAGIEAIESNANEILRKAHQVGGEYLEGVAPFQDQIRWRVFSHVFSVSYAMMLADWCRWAQTELDRWQGADEETVRRNAAATFGEMRRLLDAYLGDAADPDES
jgi:DNA-binding PadR family transcriptional regulator